MTKEKQEHQLLKRIFTFLLPYKGRLGVILSCLLLTTVFGFFQPLVIRRITDEGMLKGNMDVILSSVLLIFLLVCSGQLIELLQTRLFTNLHNRIKASLWKQTFHKILHLPIGYFNDKNNSEIINVLQTDVENVASVTDRYVVMNISFLFRVISGVAGLLIISWKLTIVVLLMVPVKYLIVREISRRKKKKMEEYIESYRDFTAWFGDNIEGVREIKLWDLFSQRQTIFETKQGQLLKNSKDNTMMDAFNLFCEILLSWSVTGLLYILGGYLIIRGTLTVGGVFSFISYSNYVTGPISSILNMKYVFSRIYPSAKRLFFFLDEDEETDRGGNVDINLDTLEINFRNVSFAYEEKGEILKGINFTINKGDKVAIIGENGSGKTTLINLLLRFFEASDGVIEVGKISIDRISMDQYRSLFAVVSQEPYLFYDTIYNNINLDRRLEADRTLEACRQSGAYDFINKLPDKENSMIGRNGAKLSGGEKKKLAVARAIIKDAPIVILDEATAGYDIESVSYLHDILLHEFTKKTVIMITHNYKHLEGMDKVYRLSDGRLEKLK